MKFIDINREFTAAASSYMAQGYYINAGTMGGSQGEVAHIDLTNGTEIIRVLLTTFNNYLGTEGVELIVGRVKDDIKPNQEDRWSTVWNERLEVISSKKFYRLNNRAQDGFYGTEEEANAAEEKRFDRYKSRRSNDSAVDVTTKAAPMVKRYVHEKFGVRRVKMDDIKVAQVVVNDDVAVDGSLYTVGRRGVAGTVFVHKIAGAKAEQGAELEEVQRVAQKVIDNVRTMGVAIRPCTVPAAGKPGFELGEDEMEVGIGIHGEPGTHKEKLRPADEIVDHILGKILADIDYTGHEVAVMVNSSGATPLMELFIINNHVADVLAAKGIKVYKTFVGEYMTSLEMEGFSVSLLRLDDELKALLDAPADTIAFKA